MGLAEVVLAVTAATATLVPLMLGVQGYLANRPEAGLPNFDSPRMLELFAQPMPDEGWQPGWNCTVEEYEALKARHQQQTAPSTPHLALEITTPAQPGADEISAASKAAQRRIDRMDADDWTRRYTALLPAVEPPQPGNGCTCEWEDAGTLSQPGQLIHTRYDADCPNHQPPERLP